MKVLTIREPWASLIINGYKKYEFRSWKTSYRGKILISTSKKMENIEKFNKYNVKYNPGYIIGEAYITDCIKVDKEFQNELIKIDSVIYGRNDHSSDYAFKLDNIKKYKKPIPCKGKLGLWNYEGEIND